MRIACLGAALGFLLQSAAFAGSGSARQPYEFISWSSTPDGSGIAYVVASRDDDTAIFRYESRSTGKAKDFYRGAPVAEGMRGIRPTWSPDGTQLAYFLPSEEGNWYLHVWSRKSDSERTFLMRAACAPSVEACKSSSLQWSADGTKVFYLAIPLAPSLSAPDTQKPQWMSLLYSDPANGGVSVRRSPGAREQVQSFEPSTSRADVVAIDLQTSRITALLEDRPIRYLSLSPDDRSLLAVAMTGNEKQIRVSYWDYYVLPVGSSEAALKPDSRQISPLIESIQLSWASSRGVWSPDSRRIAFVETSPQKSGDVQVLDVVSGQLSNITANVGLVSVRGTRDFDTLTGKFDGPLAWSADGRSLYATRRVLDESNGKAPTWRTHLWNVTVDGNAVDLTARASFDASLPIESNDALIASAQFPDGQSGFVKLGKRPGEMSVVGRFPGKIFGGQTQPVQRKGAALLFVRVGTDEPPEVFSFDLRRGKLRRQTFANDGVDSAKPFKVHAVKWTSSRGEAQVGDLYISSDLPGPATGAERPPLIVSIYPRYPYEVPARSSQYVDSARPFRKPLDRLLQAGYAIFKPDIPITGGGHSCENVAADVVAGLDAVQKSGLADVNRAAVFGHSFGGWAVNCVITRTDRFKAAVSVAGISNLVSNAFSPLDHASGWSLDGGQTAIGASIWTTPDVYWNESPVSRLQSIETPLLLVHGKLDNSVPFSQSAEMYTGMSNLGKVVELVGYDTADHSSVMSHPDYGKRVISWFERYLSRGESLSRSH